MKEIIYDVIRTGKRHQWYDYVVERTKKWKAIVSGAGLDGYMEQFNPRETTEMFEQRKRITQQITSAVCKNVRDIEYKVPRSNSIQKVVSVTNEAQKTAFDEILNSFWGDSTLNDYMDLRWVELNDTDPNSFIVTEWQPFEEDEYAQPYPYEIHAENAIMYEYDNNVLQYLIELKQDGDEKTFTGYFTNFSIRLEQMSVEDITEAKITLTDGQETEYLELHEDGTATVQRVVRIKDDYYEIYEPDPHGLGYVPAYQPGYVRDLATDGATFLPPWWAAESVLMNLVKSKSELDLTIALHVFPQKIEYAPRCSNQGCNAGIMPDGATCKVCKGTGYITHTTAQDVIRVTMPKHKEEMMDLENMVYYVYPPIDLVQFMDTYVDKLSQRAMQFVFNSEIYSRESVAETATGKEIDMQAVYDTLYPMAKAMSRDWEFMVETIGDITGIEVTASFTFSKDFKLKSLDGYYADLRMMADASSFVKANIEDDIARITFADNPEGLNKYFTQKYFYPFTGDAPETISLKMATNFVPKFYKTLYSAYGFIFDEIEREDPAFYTYTRQKQWAIIEAKVNAMIPQEQPPVFQPQTIQEVENE